jgi:hypothetical protein
MSRWPDGDQVGFRLARHRQELWRAALQFRIAVRPELLDGRIAALLSSNRWSSGSQTSHVALGAQRHFFEDDRQLVRTVRTRRVASLGPVNSRKRFPSLLTQ